MGNLTPERKAEIDAMDYETLLRGWRYAPVGDPRFQDEAGAYWAQRMADLRKAGVDAVAASKSVGWDG